MVSISARRKQCPSPSSRGSWRWTDKAVSNLQLLGSLLPVLSPHGSGPAREVQTALQTPTCIAIAAGHGQGFWGTQVDTDEEAFRLIKLAVMHPEYLDDSFQDSAALEDARRIRRFNHRTPSDLIWDYLGKIWTSSLEAAARHLGVPAEKLSLVAQHVVIGIPTNWPPDAVTRLRDVVKTAGIEGGRTTVQFLSEPEAAILARFPRLEVAARPEVCSPTISRPASFTMVPHL